MNIGIDASRAFIKHKTGTEWYSYHVIKNMVFYDLDNHYTLYTKGDISNIPFINKHNNILHKPLQWAPKYAWTQARLSYEMYCREPDVLFVPSHTLPLYSAKKSVLTVHDLAFEYFPYLYTPRAYQYHSWALKKALKKASHIITISNTTKQDLIERYSFPPNNITVVHNGFDNSRFQPIPDITRNKLVLRKYIKMKDGEENQFTYLCYVGRIENKKNILRLIKAFERIMYEKIAPLKLLLIGKPGYGYDNIIEHIRSRRLGNSIYLLGWVEQNDLAHLINASDVYVFPSLYEGFGIPILEAMSCGVPVASAHSGALPEVGENAVLYFDPNDIDDMTNKILLLLTTPNLRKDLIQKGFRQCNKFSWKKCAQETSSVIKNIKNYV